jgi:disulfide bond formation protein DsbB
MTGANLNYPYFALLGHLQTRRSLWLAGGALALGMEIFSVLYFQGRLGLKPCLYCVYIREATLLIAVGGIIAAVWPAVWPIRALGYLVSLAGDLLALIYSFKLEALNQAALHWPEAYASCGARVGFKLGRELAKRWPTHFLPQGQCGVDSTWAFLSLNMAEILIVVYLVALVGLLLGLGSGLYLTFGRSNDV